MKAVIAATAALLLGSSLVAGAPAGASENSEPTPTVITELAMNGPGGLGFLGTNGRIVVTGFNDGVARVVDAAAWSVVGEIPTEVPGQSIVQLYPDTGRAYLVGREAIVSVVDANSATLAAQIPMNPNDVNATSTLISQADVPLLLVSFAPGASPGAVALISTVTDFRRGTIVLPYETGGMAIPQDRLMMLMSNPGEGNVSFLDTFFVPFAEVPVGGNTWADRHFPQWFAGLREQC